MAEDLGSVKRMRDEFISNFSHEIKTPLFSIQGFANLMLDGGLTDEETKKFLKIISDEAGRLFKLADSNLTMTRLENQQTLGERKPLRLDSEINECIIMLEREWEAKKIEVTSSLEPIRTESDGAMLRQVWLNLLSNAVKFTPEGGKIEVGLERRGNFAVATFSDSGCGVPESEREKIFEKYYRAPSSKDVEGNGFGLAICKRILTLAGGKITVESGDKQGSKFSVFLPLD